MFSFNQPIPDSVFILRPGTVIGQAQMHTGHTLHQPKVTDTGAIGRPPSVTINTHIDSPFSRLYTDTTPQTHTIPVISGPYFIPKTPLAHHKANVPISDHLTQNHLTLSLVPFQDFCQQQEYT